MADSKKEDWVIEVFDELDFARRAILMNFAVNSAALTDQHKDFLIETFDPFLKGLYGYPADWVIALGGFCSFTGSSAANATLARQRSLAVANFLHTACSQAKKFHITTLGYGYELARADVTAFMPQKQREKAQWNWRAVMPSVYEKKRAVTPPPGKEEFHYWMRVVNQLSISLPLPGGGGALQYVLDLSTQFEIKDKNKRAATYRYTGVGVGVGIPFEKLLGLVKWLAKFPRFAGVAATLLKEIPLASKTPEKAATIITTLSDMLSGVVFKGPWNYFTHRRGPYFERPVDQWDGEANLSGYFVPFATSYSFVNFGGFEAFPEIGRAGHPGHIDPFDGGDTIGLPEASSTKGLFQLISGPYTVLD
jgi:outer membrane protein OmpA-like peptidoglycan-associated protein